MAATMTRTQQVKSNIAQGFGWRIDHSAKPTKYVTMTKPGEELKLYLGRAGAVRIGRTVADSIPTIVR